jgi:hypothetical protein
MQGVTQDRMEAALEYLSETDEPFAEAKTQVLHCEILCKRVRARVLVTEEGAMDLRKAKAEIHEDVVDADLGLCEAVEHFETLKAKRSRAEIVIDVWRSVNASQRKS